MNAVKRFVLRVVIISCVIALAPSAWADTMVRVRRDHTAVWNADFKSKLTVNAGTTLHVVGERNDWYEVLMPGRFRGETGFVHKTAVDPDDGTTPAPAAAPRGSSSAASTERSIGLVGFGEFGYARFAAQQSFQAVTGQSGTGLIGGGGEIRIRRGLFVNASVNRIASSGQRVYVADGEVFKLGVPVSISMTPVTATVGWRFDHARATPYVGGGAGRVAYHEHANFTDDSADVNARFSSYHMVGGVEFRNGWVATAFEVQYSRVPDSIGVGGASAAFQETDLGGIAARVRILVGR